MGVDPLADQFPGWSPYNYTMNNPINMIDPDGRAPDWIYDQQKDGSYKRREGVANDGGANHHTYINNDGTTMYHDVKAGTFATVNRSETKQKLANYRAKVAKRREVVAGIGKAMENTGDQVATAGYIAAPFTEGASLGVSVIGEGVSVAGKIITNSVKIEENGLTNENMIDAGADILFELLPAPAESAIKASNADNVTKKILKAELQTVNKAVEYGVDKTIEKSRGND